ncbi:MAG: hypothetical protein ACE5LQ_07120 [Candidatus Bipolaricaulia bacterium]
MISLFGELLRSMRRRRLGPLLLAVSFLTLFLALLVLFLLIFGGLGEGEEGELLALLDPQLTSAQMDRLYLEIREWDEVGQVAFFFAEEVDAGAVNIGTQGPADLFRISLRGTGEAATVAERLKGLEGVTKVIISTRGSLKNTLRAIAGLRSGVIALLLVLGLLSLMMIRSAVRSLILGWKGELRLLHLSGVSSRTMEGPFVLLALLLGLLGGLVIVLGLYIVHSWGLSHPEALYHTLPALLNPSSVLALALLPGGIGLGVGLLGGLWSLLALRRLLY